MCKMKSALYIVAIFSFALVACTERLPEKPSPSVDNGAITMVKATVNPLQLEGADGGVATYVWGESHNLGIYGSAGVNEYYRIVKSTTGDSEAYFYGNAVDGDLTIYMPHSIEGGAKALEGRVKVRAEQNYYASALEHMMYNSTFLATTKTNEVAFDYYSGILKLSIVHNMNDVSNVKVMVANVSRDAAFSEYIAGYLPLEGYEAGITEQENGVTTVNIGNFPEGVNSTEEAPLTVWVALAPGTYENFLVQVANKDGYAVNIPVSGPFVVERCKISEQVCEVKMSDKNYGPDHFVGEEGNFNESK